VDADGSSAVAAGIVVRNPEGRPQVLAATDENSRLLGLFQLQRGEGPCIATMLSGEPVSMRDVTTDARASAKFEETAVRLGFQSMHAFPMCRRDERIGALSLFYARPTVLSAPDTRALQLLADLATISVLHLRALRHSRHLSAQLQSALDSRVVIEQAKGMLSVAGDLDMKAAYARLRAGEDRDAAAGDRADLVELRRQVLSQLQADPEQQVDVARRLHSVDEVDEVDEQ
jgi:hypothetical protein